MTRSDERQELLETLPTLEELASMDTAHLDLRELTVVILPALVKLLTPDLACVYSPSASGPQFEATACFPSAFWDQPDISRQFRVREPQTGALRHAINSGEIQIVDDTTTAQARGDYIPFTEKVRLEILVPLRATDPFTGSLTTIAVVVLSWFSLHRITDARRSLLLLLRSIIARHCELICARIARERQSRFLDSFGSMQSQADDLYGPFLEALCVLFPIRLATFWRYSSQPEALILRSVYPPVLDGECLTPTLISVRALRLHESPVHSVLATMQPRLFRLGEVTSDIPNESFLHTFDLKWWVSLPIMSVSLKPLGVVNVWPEGQPENFNRESITTLMSYASRMRDVIGLARLTQRASLVDAFRPLTDNLLTFEDRREAWDGLARLIANLLKAEACSIFLAPSPALLRLKGSTGLVNDPPYETVTYGKSEGLTWRAFTSHHPLLYIRDLDAELSAIHMSKFRERLLTAGPSRSILFAPIRGPHGENLGVIRCNNKCGLGLSGEHQFTADDVAAAELIATVISHLHLTSSRMAASEIDRSRRLRSLHHEIISPVDHLAAHLGWIRKRLTHDMKSLPTDRLRLKLEDMDQIGQAIVNLTMLLDEDSTERRLDSSPIAITEVITATLAYMTHEARRLSVRVSPLLERVDSLRCDKEAVMRICYNLFRNSLKYADVNEHDRYMLVQLASDEDEDRVVLKVEDNGIGVPTGEEELIFDRFRRGSNAVEHAPLGEGLGLWYCRQLVTRMGGRIWLASRHKPTRFQLFLPR